MSYNIHNGSRNKFFLSDSVFPQTIDVIKTKCHALGIDLVIENPANFDWASAKDYMGMLVQNPDNFGNVKDFSEISS